MAWGTADVKDQRMRFVVHAKRRDKTMRELCAEFAISRPTGYEWLRRYTAGGIVGVVERSRRPRSSATKTAQELEERVVELREQRPDWGARKLDGRALVYYCRSLVRDLDLLTQRSTALDRWVS